MVEIKNKIKELLGTNSLDLLNDAQLIEYLESKLHSTINVYIKLIEKSDEIFTAVSNML